MPPVGFEPTISAGERPQTYALDRAATGTGYYDICYLDLLSTAFSIDLILPLPCNPSEKMHFYCFHSHLIFC